MASRVRRPARVTNGRLLPGRHSTNPVRTPIPRSPTGRPDTVTAGWLERIGPDEGVPAEHGRLADLTVLAKPSSKEASADVEKRFASALFGSARPVLLAPEHGVAEAPRTVAVAWNGSAECARALLGALPLLENPDRQHVLTAATPRTRVESGAALAEYLGWHGRLFEVHPIPREEEGPALLARARELGARLLVMGGDGRSRMRDRIFGGVTRHVPDHGDLPLLIAH